MSRLVVTHPILGTLDTEFNANDFGIYKDELGWRIFGYWFYGDNEPAVRADIPIDDDVRVSDSKKKSVICAVCKKPIEEDVTYVRHARLNAYVHYLCPWDNVMGEDIRTHTMQFFNFDPYLMAKTS